MRINFWGRTVIAVVGLLAASSAPGLAQRATRGLTPVPANTSNPRAQASVSVDPPSTNVGQIAQVCFSATATGYVTLWDVSATGQATRIFPNQFTSVGPAMQVQGGQKYCAGATGDAYRFRVDPPTGVEDLYMLWTTRTELQPTATSYPTADALVQGLQSLAGADLSQWATAKVTFDINPPGGPVAPQVPTPSTSGRVGNDSSTPPAPVGQNNGTGQPPPGPVGQNTTPQPPPGQQTSSNSGPQVWVFAMGANVTPLTKSNQDAQVFTESMQKLFEIPDDHIAYKANGTSVDFNTGMKWLSDVAGPKDYVFIYFSGHGTTIDDPKAPGGVETYIVPYDYNPNEADTTKHLIWSQRVNFLVNQLQTKRVVLVFDTCFSGGMTRAMTADVLGARKKFLPLPTTMIAGNVGADSPPGANSRGRIVANGLLLAAAQPDQSAYEGPDGSYFTMDLVKEMASPAGGTLMDVFGRARTDTLDDSKNKQGPLAVGDKTVGQNINFDKN